jgi:outer membrane protein assembly factor BamB
VAPPRVLRSADGSPIVLLALENSVEARRADNGERLWSRSDLDGAGLSVADPVATPSGEGLGWAGAPSGAPPRLVVISPADGRTLFEAPLPAAPNGGPTPVATSAGATTTWVVPLADNRVFFIPISGEPKVLVSFGAPVTPPLVVLGGRVLALVGETRDLISLAAPARRPAARGLERGTITVADSVIFAAGDRSAETWRCRLRSTGAVSCGRRWRQLLGGAVTAPPLSVGEKLFVGSWDTYLYAFDRRNGHLLWRTRAGLRLVAPLLEWTGFVAAASDGVALVQFFRADDGASAGKVEGQENEIFISGVARAGELLVTSVLPFPSLRPALRAYRIEVPAPRQDQQPSGAAPAPASARWTEPLSRENTYSFLSAERKRDSRSR